MLEFLILETGVVTLLGKSHVGKSLWESSEKIGMAAEFYSLDNMRCLWLTVHGGTTLSGA